MSMDRDQLVRFVFRRIADPNRTKFDADDDVVPELNQAIADMAVDVELSSVLPRLQCRETINLTGSQKEYPISTVAGVTYLVTRKAVRTDLGSLPRCRKVDFDDLDAYVNTDGLNDLMGFVYAIGPMSNGELGLILPVAPMGGGRIVHHFTREPRPLETGSSLPDGIPGPFHRIVGLLASLRLIGADNANQAAYAAMQNEMALKRQQMLDFLRLDNEPQEVMDVTEYA